jgi:hypothetical protein
MKQTAVEWLKEQLESYGDPEYCKVEWLILDELMEQAKEMEKTSICSFTTSYVNNCVEIDHNEIELTKEVEEYYDYQSQKQNENN